MADKQDRASCLCDIARFTHALALKCGITTGQHLIHHQDLRLQVGCNCKCQSQVHSTGKTFNGCIDELLHLRKCDNLIKFSLDLEAFHSEDGTVKIDILAPGQLRMETCADF